MNSYREWFIYATHQKNKNNEEIQFINFSGDADFRFQCYGFVGADEKKRADKGLETISNGNRQKR